MKNPILTITAALLVAACSIHAQEKAAAPSGKLQAAASKWTFPKVEFRESTVRESLEFLAARAKMIDPEGKGINIILNDETPAGPPVPPVPVLGGTKVTLTLNDVPLTEVFKYIGHLANHRIRWDEHAVVFTAPKPGKRDLPPAAPRPALKAAPGAKAAVERLSKIIVPKVSFKESTAEEAFEFLSQRGKTLDPEGTPVNFVVKVDEAANVPKVSFDASNLSLLEVARYAAELAGLQLNVEPHAVVISQAKK